MPRKSGHKLLFELKRDRDLSRIPVLIVTAHAHDELGKRDLEDIMDNAVMSGPGTYLEKPVNPESYVRAISRAVGVEPAAGKTPRSRPQGRARAQHPGREPRRPARGPGGPAQGEDERSAPR